MWICIIFIRKYIGSKDTLKNVNLNILDILEDWYFNRIFRYFLDAQVIQSYGISSYEYAECESESFLSENILDQKIHWRTWTLIFWIYLKIGISTQYFDISWMRKSSKVIEYHHMSMLNANLNHFYQKIYWIKRYIEEREP